MILTPNINMLKSQYELLMDQFETEGKVVTFGETESLAIVENLNSGMEDFLSQQTVNEIDSELELSEIVLNA